MYKKFIRKCRQYLYKIKCLVLRKKIDGYDKIDGWLALEEAVALYQIALKLPPSSTVVEIGSWKGKSTYCIAKGLDSGDVLYAIDPFQSSEKMNDECAAEYNILPQKNIINDFRMNMSSFDSLNIVYPKIGFSHDFVDEIPVIDFLFIDGDHSIEGCDYDYTNYAPKIKKGGYLAFHDYNASVKDQGPTLVVHNKVLPSGEYSLVGIYGTLWIAQKNSF